jgi:glycosyltransferase involved in cell wall biosynthesis
MSNPLPEISVIICTHDPRGDYLAATLEALRAQTLPLEEWEFLLVDNLSTPPLSERISLAWHPSGRHVREEKIGLSNARICGLKAARAKLIIFVDDDNLLAPDYLANALKIAAEWPSLGVWGCHIEGRFEGGAPVWVKQFAYHLAVRECPQPVWASYVDDRNVPYGAGMCLRSAVGRAYIAKSETDALCTKLDRIGKGMGAAGDHDICHTAQDLGLGIGRFPSLRMTHLIPPGRMQPDYFLKLVRGNARAALLLAIMRKSAASYRTTRFWPFVKMLRSRLFKRGMESRILCAQAQGELDALREIRSLGTAEAR